MYNSIQKQEFIENYTGITSNNYIPNLFEKCSQVEDSLQKDVCDFTRTEILDLFISFNSSTAHTLFVKKSLLKQYTDFCCENNLSKDNINHFEEVSQDDMKLCVNQFLQKRLYTTKERLDEWCEELINPMDSFILYCLFEGIKGEYCQEITDMKIKDIDEKLNVVKLCTGRIVPVSKELVFYAKLADQQSDYITERSYEFFPSDTIVKTRLNNIGESFFQKQQRIHRKVINLKKQLDATEVTIPRLINSGFIYHLLELERETGIDKYKIIKDNGEMFKQLKEKYCFSERTEQHLTDMVSGYLGK